MAEEIDAISFCPTNSCGFDYRPIPGNAVKVRNHKLMFWCQCEYGHWTKKTKLIGSWTKFDRNEATPDLGELEETKNHPFESLNAGVDPAPFISLGKIWWLSML